MKWSGVEWMSWIRVQIRRCKKKRKKGESMYMKASMVLIEVL